MCLIGSSGIHIGEDVTSSFSEYYDFTITNTSDNTGIEIDFSETTIVNINLFDINIQVTRGWIE